jgi:ribose transport system permease protein
MGEARQVADEPEERSIGSRILWLVEAYAVPVLFLGVLVWFSLWSRTRQLFPTDLNIENVLGEKAVIGILALAIMIPLVCGEQDFSVGSISGIAHVLCAGVMARMGLPLVLAILVAIVVGLLIGLSNGSTVAHMGVNSLIVTLGVSSVLLGLVQWYTGGQSISRGLSSALTDFGAGELLGLPTTMWFLAAVSIAVWYLLERTPFGRYLHGIGSNREAARLVGLPVERYVLLAFVLSGTLAGIAGVLLVARNGTANPQVGTVADTLQALSAAYLGATAFRPGRFNVPGTLVAIFFLAFTVNGLSLAGVENWINSVFNGAALFLAVLISTVVGRKRAETG